jgi:hypothetical protein
MIAGEQDASFKGWHFTSEVILWALRWYLAFPISYRDLALSSSGSLSELSRFSVHRSLPDSVWQPNQSNCIVHELGGAAIRTDYDVIAGTRHPHAIRCRSSTASRMTSEDKWRRQCHAVRGGVSAISRNRHEHPRMR